MLLVRVYFSIILIKSSVQLGNIQFQLGTSNQGSSFTYKQKRYHLLGLREKILILTEKNT